MNFNFIMIIKLIKINIYIKIYKFNLFYMDDTDI